MVNKSNNCPNKVVIVEASYIMLMRYGESNYKCTINKCDGLNIEKKKKRKGRAMSIFFQSKTYLKTEKIKQ